MTLTRGSVTHSSNRCVPSEEPLSTTTTSKSTSRCHSADASACRSIDARLYVDMTIETVGGDDTDGALPLGD